MTLIRFLSKLVPIAAILLLISSAGAAPDASWGVNVGDTAIYWVDDVRFNGSENIAPLLGDNNRTNLAIVEGITSNSLNYTLGLQNGTNFVDNQQVRITETKIGDNSLLLPNGSLPLYLPLSVDDQSNYLTYLRSVAESSDLIVASLLSNNNVSNVRDVGIEGVYLGGFLNLTVQATLDDLDDLSLELVPFLNATTQFALGENQTINHVDLDLLFSYNSTDGMMTEFDFNSAINTTETLDGGSNISRMVTFNTTIIRQSFISILDNIDEDDVSSLSSELEGLSFLMTGTIPALYLLRRRKD